jgi:hypothetical protein
MFSSILGSLGSMFGKMFGGGLLSTVGRFMGSWIGSLLDEKDEEEIEYYKVGSQIDNFYPISYACGLSIPLVFGRARVYGQLIWSDIIEQVSSDTREVKYFSKHTAIYNNTEFFYYCDFAVSICEGEIEDIERVWINNEITDISIFDYKIYKGGSCQMPDPLISSKFPAGQCPAFKDLAYIVFKKFPLIEYGNKIPSFSFEVYRKPNHALADDSGCTENKVKGVNIIPGSGEFVYDTDIIEKTYLSYEMTYKTSKINSNNKAGVSDSVYSFDYLKEICPNVEWVSPVVSWFADSTDIKDCSIYPAVEFGPDTTKFTKEWKVAGFSRKDAREISKDSSKNPNYGGSVNDESVVNYLKFLKSRGVKIAFYPMIFLDVAGKPWRGRLSGDTSEIEGFFNKEDGYNNFIIHYARLVKDYVDAFIIGSELIGLTKIRNGSDFPAVNELVKLAEIVKSITGSKVKVTYAADWSEYHHTEGGWYNLDKLWASSSIDFIGIDNYMPLTSSVESTPSAEEIRKYFDSGQGYDYYLDGEDKKPLEPEYAWKNIEWWWNNHHKNPDGNLTEWSPRSKKIWFTEFGFPSIDKASNQPNIFFDPRCVDGGVPKHSNGEFDMQIQRDSISEFIDFWSSKEFIENMFLWCFDARPYPAWPHSKKWGDWHLWEKGHWINGKFGTNLLSGIIREISKRSNIDSTMIDTTSLSITAHNMMIKSPKTSEEVIDLLKMTYNLTETILYDGRISFKDEVLAEEAQILKEDLVANNNNYFKCMINSDEIFKGSLSIIFNDITEEYCSSSQFISLDDDNNKFGSLVLPLAISNVDARILAKNILAKLKSNAFLIHFILPLNYMFLKSGDIIFIDINEVNSIKLKIVKSEIKDMKIDIFACKIEENISNYSYLQNYNLLPEEDGEIIQIFLPDNYSTNKVANTDTQKLYFINSFSATKNLQISISGGSFYTIKKLKPGTKFGKVVGVSFLHPNYYLIDDKSYIDVEFQKDIPYIGEYDFKAPSSVAVSGNYIFTFGKVRKISDKILRFSRIIHHKKFEYADRPKKEQKFYMLDRVSEVEISSGVSVENIYYLSGSKKKRLIV